MDLTKEKEEFNIFCEYTNFNKISESIFNKIKISYKEHDKIPTHRYDQYERLLKNLNYMWIESKKRSDFNIVKPHLESLVEINKEFINCFNNSGNNYDTLLGLHNLGMSTDKLDETFYELKDNIINLLDRIRVNKRQINNDFFGKQSLNIQKDKLNNIVLENFREYINYNTYSENLFLCNIEFNIIKKVKGFWKALFLKLKESVEELDSITFNNFYREINETRPSVLVKDSDELTYILHMLIRYEIEKKLINDEIKVEDLPICWMCKYKEYLNVTPANDFEGILQEVNWFQGNFSSFPKYILNNIYISQLLDKFESDLMYFQEDIEKGNLNLIYKLIKFNIDQHSYIDNPHEFIKQVTNKEPNAKYLISYLNKKYTEIYHL